MTNRRITSRHITTVLAGLAPAAFPLAAPALAQTASAPAATLAAPATGAATTNLTADASAASALSTSDALSRVPHLSGTVQGFDGSTVFVIDGTGTTQHVTLHKGTIINPTGIELREGMKVTVYGAADGAAFAATEIDTPYRGDERLGFVPAFGFAPGYGYGPRVYPAYGFAYGYPRAGYGRFTVGARHR